MIAAIFCTTKTLQFLYLHILSTTAKFSLQKYWNYVFLFQLLQFMFHFLFRAIQFTRREIKLAYVTITIVGVFFILNIPRVFMGAYEVSKMYLVIHCAEYRTEYHPEMWYYRSDNVCRLFMVLNSSINFLIYCIGNDQFKVLTGIHLKST